MLISDEVDETVRRTDAEGLFQKLPHCSNAAELHHFFQLHRSYMLIRPYLYT